MRKVLNFLNHKFSHIFYCLQGSHSSDLCCTEQVPLQNIKVGVQ